MKLLGRQEAEAYSAQENKLEKLKKVGRDERIHELSRQGKSQREIAKTMDIGKSRVDQVLNASTKVKPAEPVNIAEFKQAEKQIGYSATHQRNLLEALGLGPEMFEYAGVGRKDSMQLLGREETEAYSSTASEKKLEKLKSEALSTIKRLNQQGKSRRDIASRPNHIVPSSTAF
jgi:hypothetical protein